MDPVQARREAEAKRRLSAGRGATSISFGAPAEARRPSATTNVPAPTFGSSASVSFASGNFTPARSFGSFTPPSASTPASTSEKPKAEFSPTSSANENEAPQVRKVTLNSAQQHQRQSETAQRLASQMQAFGIAQMVLPSDESMSQIRKSERPESGTRSGEQTVPDSDVLAMIPRRGLFQCYVVRDKSTFKTMMNPKYALFATRTNGFLLAGRKRANKQTSNYLVSLDQEDLERNSENFFGKVRSNVAGTEFIVYDKGCKPGEQGELREELCAILYESNVAGMKGPRKMKVIVPALKDDDTHRRWRPTSDEESMVAEYKRNPDSNEFVVLTNKEPTWNEQLRSYQLNFHGRVTKPSVKNFQLCDVRQPNRVVLQFGKVEDSKFNLDFQYPLTCFQAFAICLTSFDNKLACQ